MKKRIALQLLIVFLFNTHCLYAQSTSATRISRYGFDFSFLTTDIGYGGLGINISSSYHFILTPKMAVGFGTSYGLLPFKSEISFGNVRPTLNAGKIVGTFDYAIKNSWHDDFTSYAGVQTGLYPFITNVPAYTIGSTYVNASLKIKGNFGFTYVLGCRYKYIEVNVKYDIILAEGGAVSMFSVGLSSFLTSRVR